MNRFIVTFFILFTLCGNSFAAVLVMSPNGTFTTKTDLATAAIATDAVGKTVVVTSPQIVTTAIVWPDDRELKYEKDGYITFTGAGTLIGLKEVRPEWFGAKGDGVSDDLTAFQTASNILRDNASSAIYGGNRGGTIILTPGREYVFAGLVLGSKVSIYSPAKITFSDDMSQTKGGIATLRHDPSKPTIPMIRTDDSSLTAPTRTGGSDDGQPKFWSRNSFTNIYFEGIGAVAGTLDADAIRLHNSWSVDVIGCAFNRIRGFAVRAIDSNVIRLERNTFMSPIFATTLSDSVILNNQMGGTMTPLWLAGGGSSVNWQSIISNNLIYNQVAGTVWNWTYSGSALTLSFASGTLAVSQLVDGTPVMLKTTGTLPTGVNDYTTYFIKRISDSDTRLCATLADVRTGTYISLSGGSGTHSLIFGASANIAITAGKWFTISGNRFDQAYENNIALYGSTFNSISNNTIVGAGLANVTGQAGLLLKTSSRNTVSGNVIDGTVYASGGNNTNQVYGVLADSSSALNRISPSNQIYNNATSDISMPLGWISGDSSVFIPALNFSAIAGAPALSVLGGGRYAALAFDQTAQEAVSIFTGLPDGFLRFTAKVVWVNGGAGAGAVRWQISALDVLTGNTIANSGASGSENSTAGAADIVVTTTGTGITLTNTKHVALRVYRIAADAADTLPNDAGMLGLLLEQY